MIMNELSQITKNNPFLMLNCQFSVFRSLAVLAGAALVCCSCAGLPSGQTMAVYHQPLKLVKKQGFGTVVLREVPDRKPMRFVGSPALHGSQWFALFNPAFLTGSLLEIEGSKPLDTVIREDLAEALDTAGYRVVQQANPKRSVPRAGRDRAIVEFNIMRFDYSYETEAGKPDEFSLDIKVCLLSPTNQAVLWEKRYTRDEENGDQWRAYFTSCVLTDVLNEMAKDFASESFAREIP